MAQSGVKHDFYKLAGQFKVAAQLIAQQRVEVHKVLGIQVLSWGWQDFDAKSRGGTGGDGVKWKPIQRLSIAGRLLGRKIGEPIRRKLRSDAKGGSKAMRGAILARAADPTGPTPKFAAAVDAEFANHAIGIDTGRLKNSLRFGGPDNLFNATVQQVEVGVGSGVQYAEEFDRARPIFVEPMPAARVKALEEIAARAIEKVITQATKGSGEESG